MIYNNLIVNTKLIQLFNNYIDKNLPHSFIFHGERGTGKFGHAIEFSNLILSKNSNSSDSKLQILANFAEKL